MIILSVVSFVISISTLLTITARFDFPSHGSMWTAFVKILLFVSLVAISAASLVWFLSLMAAIGGNHA